ncbi:uncharacterized protein METZ01_LOCUS277125 [marine metagenome]|uniref:Uncharacterized protein n=1 Tax=marine metagenome TaxID=408172 RepID=A0A382KNL4_9ZZZZ
MAFEMVDPSALGDRLSRFQESASSPLHGWRTCHRRNGESPAGVNTAFPCLTKAADSCSCLPPHLWVSLRQRYRLQ